MGYKFKLESILNFRENVEDMLKAEFFKIKEELNEKEVGLETLANHYKDEVEWLLSKGKLTPNELELCKGYLSRIKEVIEEKKGEVERFKEKASRKQQELLSVRKDRRMLEVIKDKCRKENIKVELKKEQAGMDEFNSNMFVRRVKTYE